MSAANPPYTKLPDIDLLVMRIMEAGQKVLANFSNVGVRLLPGKKMFVEVTVSWPNRWEWPLEPAAEAHIELSLESKAAFDVMNSLGPCLPGPWRVLPGRPGYVEDQDGAAIKANGDMLALMHLMTGLKRRSVQGVLAVPGFNHGAVLDGFPLIMDRLGERLLLRLHLIDEVLTMAAVEKAVLADESTSPAKPAGGRRRI